MKVKFATVCMHVTYDKQENLAKYLDFIDEAADNGADLIVFPEQSLQGYLTNVVAMDVSLTDRNEFDYQYENAEIVPDGPSTLRITEKAQERGIHVVIGMTEKDTETDYKLYNSAVLVGPDGYIGTYRKVHQPMDELHSYYGGDSFPVFQTSLGRIGLLICYDKWFPETTRELVLGGAEILVMPTATAFSDPDACDYSTDYAYYTFDLHDKVRALENQTFFIGSNQVGVCGLSTYFGHSNIVSPMGRIVSTTGDKEGIAYYTSENLLEETFKAKRAFAGMNFLKDRRPSTYTRLNASSGSSNYN